VTTTGNNSIGLYATGSASTDTGPVPSSISAQNVNVTTQGSNANGLQADNGGQVTLNGFGRGQLRRLRCRDRFLDDRL